MSVPNVLESSLVRLRDMGLDENWLQEYLSKNPQILELDEDLILIQRERRQLKAGRLDLLFCNADGDTRYEVEVMLGAIDESHIIRTIEYWDIERRRYPAYEHIAVIVAEDVTSRFVNVLSLFSGTIPLVVLQLSTLKLNDGIVVVALKVLDQRALRHDDSVESSAQPSDRGAWKNKSSEKAMATVDEFLGYLNEATKPDRYELNYKPQYIGLTLNGRARNVVLFWPRKSKIVVMSWVSDPHAAKTILDAAGISSKFDGDQGIVANFENYEELKGKEAIKNLLVMAVAYQLK